MSNYTPCAWFEGTWIISRYDASGYFLNTTQNILQMLPNRFVLASPKDDSFIIWNITISACHFKAVAGFKSCSPIQYLEAIIFFFSIKHVLSSISHSPNLTLHILVPRRSTKEFVLLNKLRCVTSAHHTSNFIVILHNSSSCGRKLIKQIREFQDWIQMAWIFFFAVPGPAGACSELSPPAVM